ncbi:MAG: hypothetical protein R3324_10785, partial [Halobacteriales archaeon]|nr:hypothetical protein [Halobacteriales archaeon]
EILTFTGVRGGDREIAFEDLASYCSVDEPTSVRVLPGTVTRIDVILHCVYSVEGRVLFSVLTSDGWRLHTVAPDGRDLVPFGDHDGLTEDQQRPSISTDGSRIVFTYGGDPKAFYAIDPDGTNMRPIPGGSGLTPKVSPDGERIAFSADQEIWVMDFDGSNRVQVTNGPGFSHSPAWSPDGNRLAFEVLGATWNLYTINVDGTDLTPITADHADDDLDPDYRPDGERLAFHSKRAGPKIVTTTPDGSDLVELVEVGWDPVWSPDGGRIAYHVDSPYQVGLYLVDVATGEIEWLSATLPGVRAVHAAWGPPLP